MSETYAQTFKAAWLDVECPACGGTTLAAIIGGTAFHPIADGQLYPPEEWNTTQPVYVTCAACKHAWQPRQPDPDDAGTPNHPRKLGDL